MVFREVSVIEIREVLRSWLAGAGLRKVAGAPGSLRLTERSPASAASWPWRPRLQSVSRPGMLAGIAGRWRK